MRRVSIKGVLIGNVADIAASTIFGVLVAVFVLVFSRMAHLPRTTLHQHHVLTGVLMISGLLFSTMGGYIAAWIAKHDEMLNGGLSSFLCVLVSLFQFLIGPLTHTSALVPLIAAPACAVLGGYLRLKQQEALKPIGV